MSRSLYLVAYDICQPRRLARVCRYLKGYRVAGQKSVPEIWITPAELGNITRELRKLIDEKQDRLQIIALDPRMKPLCRGQAATFQQNWFTIM